MEKQKFGVRDLINIGVFTVLIFIASFLGAMVAIVPFLMPLLPFMCGLLSGPIFMLYTTKIKRFGMVTVMEVLLIIFFVSSGHGWYCVGGFVTALIADFILKKGKYQSVKYARLSYTVFSLSGIFGLLPIYLSRDSYAQNLINTGYGKEYAANLMSVMPDWTMIPITLTGCVGAYIGCTIGIKILKKHFEKAGMV